MKRTWGKIKRTISVLLAAAMIVTALPQASVPVHASEAQDVPDEDGGSGGMQDDIQQDIAKENDPAGAADGAQQEGAGSGDQGDSQGTEEDGSAVQPDTGEGMEADQTEIDDGTDADDVQDSDGTEADERQSDDETNADGHLADEETDTDESETDANQSANRISVLSKEDGEVKETATVRFNIPSFVLYDNGSSLRYRSCIKTIDYAVGESEEYTRLTEKVFLDGGTVDIDAVVGEKLRFKIVTRTRVVIDEVSYAGSEAEAESVALEPVDSVYTIESIPSGSGTESACTIDIKADFSYRIQFVDVYASQHEGERSVSFFQYQAADNGEAAGSGDAGKDMIGETVELTGSQVREYFKKYNYELKLEENFTLHSIDANADNLTYIETWIDSQKETKRYTLSGTNGTTDLGTSDITVFILAEPTKTHTLQFNIPDGLSDKLKVCVTDAAGNEQPVENNSVEVPDDMSVMIQAWLEDDPDHTLRAAVTAADGETVELPYDYRDKINNPDKQTYAWRNTYYIDNMLKDGNVTIAFSQIDMYQVAFRMNREDEIGWIALEEPYVQDYGREDAAELDNLSVGVAEGERLKFYAEPKKGGALHVSASADGSDEIEVSEEEESYYGWYYAVTPTASMTLYLTMTEGYQYQFDYKASDFDIIVCDENGEQLGLTDENQFIDQENMTANFRIMVKPLSEKWRAVSVIYDKEMEGRQEARREPDYDKDGYLCYVANEAVSSTYRSSTITIDGYNPHYITFSGNKTAQEENVWLRRWVYEWEEWSYAADISVGDKLEVKDGEKVYFTVLNYSEIKYNLALSLSGSDGRLMTYERDDWDYDQHGTLYYFTAASDTTINAELAERAEHTVTIGCTESVTGFRVQGATTRPDDETECTGTYFVRDGQTIRIEGISNDTEGTLAEEYRGRVTCTIGEETYEVPMKNEYHWNNDTMVGTPYFEIEVTDDMQLKVDIMQASRDIRVSFANPDKIVSARIWELGDYAAENLYNNETKEAVLSNEKEYYLDFQMRDGYAAQSVAIRDKASGAERQLRLMDGSHRIYETGIPQNDAEIVIDAVPGYTVLFDVPAGSDITFEEDITEWGFNDITKEGTQVAATESFPFRITYDDGTFSLALDSEAFTLKKTLKSNEWNEMYYQYMISPNADAEIPETVTVKVKEYEKHTVTLDYPEEIKKIYLLDDTGSTYKITDHKAEVQGISTVLGVKAISGYTAKVSVKGSGEAKELTPFRIAEGDVNEYYLGELTEDVTVTVTVERSTQKLTYYQVGFYSAGNRAVIRDTVSQTQYMANEGYEEEEGFEYPYAVLKGAGISFTVDAAEGYEVDCVYANTAVVTPVLNPQGQEIYTVIPQEDTLIKVKTSKIAEKYPITFTYPAAVKSVTVTGHEPENGKYMVKEGTPVAFAVELADTKHRITRVMMNGRELSADKDGGYRFIAVAGPMEVVITAAEITDRKVTFKNTIDHMLYSVVLNAYVTESEKNTYVVAELADVLRFTVTSSKKDSVPVVSYTGSAGSRIVLQEKKKQESESTIAYTYEISAADLPAESEIVIEESSLAGAEDKAKLAECINQYKDKYVQDEYTAESWEVYAKALKDAEDCAKKEAATKAEVTEAIDALQKAAAGLVKKGDTPDPGPDVPDGLWFEILENPEPGEDSYTYTGAAVKPEIKVYHGKELLQAKKDYTVAYKNNTNAGTATITVTGKGNFKGNAAATFEIKQKDIGDEDIIAPDSICAVINSKGGVGNPKVAVKFGKKTLKANNDYKVVWPSDTEFKDAQGKAKAGEYEVTISTTAVKTKNGTPSDSVNYTGERKIKYTVCASDIKLMGSAKITLDKTKVDYAGELGADTDKPLVTSVKIGKTTLEADDYTVSYDENWNKVGKATVTVTAKEGSKYFGSKSVTYTVNGTKLAAKELKIEGINASGYDYTGGPIYVSKNGDNPGSLKVTRIKANGKPIEGGGTLLEEGKDYTVSYKTGKKTGEHTNAGTVTVTITGINAYTGSVNRTFKIKPIDLAAFGTANPPAGLVFAAPEKAKYTKTGAKFADEDITLTFNGEPLVEKRDYTVSYTKNTTVRKGEKSAAMTIKGKGNFKGSYKHTYEVTIASEADVYATAVDIVKPAKLSQVKSTVKVYEASTGKVLKAGTDYEKAITYYSDAACAAPITADNFATAADVDKEIYAKINMKGNYAGTTGTPGTVTAKFRVYNKDLKMTSKKLVVTVDTTKDKGGKDIGHDGTKNKNPYYTGAVIEPKVTVTLKGSGDVADQLLTEGVDYRVEYTNNKNKGKATVTVIGIGNGYGGSKSLKFTIVPKNMDWAEQAAKAAQKALEVFTELSPQN